MLPPHGNNPQQEQALVHSQQSGSRQCLVDSVLRLGGIYSAREGQQPPPASRQQQQQSALPRLLDPEAEGMPLQPPEGHAAKAPSCEKPRADSALSGQLRQNAWIQQPQPLIVVRESAKPRALQREPQSLMQMEGALDIVFSAAATELASSAAAIPASLSLCTPQFLWLPNTARRQPSSEQQRQQLQQEHPHELHQLRSGCLCT
ncbi:hypothetical protein cyc_02852 [Cyclospora cayetanensis]|uniref:Uncharacterized protein n=1 Tax=Cyclospora cayetanensis TaxID=88456 RepID=A0A1D3CZI7_9EIME|nr:hypothetical protein cyc_02852 [Cyclospora cayetanensis]